MLTNLWVYLSSQALYMLQHDLAYMTDPDGNQVTVQALWKIFVERNPKLPCKYLVYCYFKDAGYELLNSICFPSVIISLDPNTDNFPSND